jgi:hypothetical protein
VSVFILLLGTLKNQFLLRRYSAGDGPGTEVPLRLETVDIWPLPQPQNNLCM